MYSRDQIQDAYNRFQAFWKIGPTSDAFLKFLENTTLGKAEREQLLTEGTDSI